MERRRSGTHYSTNDQSAHEKAANQSRVSTPSLSATSPVQPGKTSTEHERLRVVGGAKEEQAPRRKTRKRITPRFFAFVACAALIFLVVSYAVAFWRIRQVEQKILTVKSQIEAAKARNDQLRAELEKVTGDDYVEEVAREQLGLVKPGETAWVLMAPSDADSPYRVQPRQTARANASEGW